MLQLFIAELLHFYMYKNYFREKNNKSVEFQRGIYLRLIVWKLAVVQTRQSYYEHKNRAVNSSFETFRF